MTLTDRLRRAALIRVQQGARIADNYVIDDQWVIDLGALEDRHPESRSTDFAHLASIAGRFGDAADVSDLFDGTAPTGSRLWKPREPSTESPDPPSVQTPPENGVDPHLAGSEEMPEPVAPLDELDSDDDEPSIDLRAEWRELIIDLRAESSLAPRPPAPSDEREATCPSCGAPGVRDYEDEFLDIDFYSCTECFHMWHAASHADETLG